MSSFLNPLALLFLLTVPLLILLYFLKLKRPQITVASTLLWQKVVEDMRVNSPFQKLKRSLLLLLQLLILLGLILALSRPLLKGAENRDESFVVLIDNSASMGAIEAEGKTRLALAQDEAAKLIGKMSRNDELMLISFNATSRMVSGFSTNKRRLKDALSTIEPTECPTVITPALTLARSVANSRQDPRILVYSDGAFESVSDLDLPAEVEFKQVGTDRPNLSVVGLDIRRAINNRNKVEMFVAVENLGSEMHEGTMLVKLDGKVIKSEVFSIKAGGNLSQIFEAHMDTGGVIEVELDVDDALACDNRAWKIVLPPRPRRVLVVGRNLFFLTRMLKASVGVDFRTVGPDEYDPAEAAKYSTVVWSAVAEPGIANTDNIYLGCVPQHDGLVTGEEINAPPVLDWDHTHPVTRFLDFDNLLVSSTTKMEMPEYGRSILGSTQTSLIGLFEANQGQICIVGFKPLQSNWPLLVSFPLFFSNCFAWFDDQRNRSMQTNIQSGEVLSAPATLSAPEIQTPDGARTPMLRNTAGDYTFAGTQACGIYEVLDGAASTRVVAVNLFNRTESTLSGAAEPVIGGKTLEPVRGELLARKELWHTLLVIALVLLAGEWLVYHRRVFL